MILILSFFCPEIDHCALYVEVENVVIRLQTLLEGFNGVEGRCEPSHAGHDGTRKPVGNLLFSCDVETGQQFTARFQCTEYFGLSSGLVWKHMESVHAEHLVERAAFKRQCAHIALHRLDITDASSTESALCLFQHVAAVVETGDVGLVLNWVQRYDK